MRRRRPRSRQKAEPTIALINVVFLMLVFFLVAGTLTPPMDDRIELVTLADLEGRQPPNALMIHADGSVTWRGEAINPSDFSLPEDAAEAEGQLRILPDRDLPARVLMQVVAALQDAGAEEIFLVTARGLE
jgi:biopolymer transport protein ExbD